MKKQITLVLVLALGAGSIFSHRDSAPAEPGLRFVDLNRCMDEIPAISREGEKLQATYSPIMNRLRENEKLIKGLAGELAAMNTQSDEYLTRSYQLETDRLALERQTQFQLRKYNNAQAEAFIRATRLIHEAAAELGKLKGYAGIMVKPFSLQELSAEVPMAVEALRGRRLLWSHPEYDITQEVIDFLVDNS